jgi:hypothetical protein
MRKRVRTNAEQAFSIFSDREESLRGGMVK